MRELLAGPPATAYITRSVMATIRGGENARPAAGGRALGLGIGVIVRAPAGQPPAAVRWLPSATAALPGRLGHVDGCKSVKNPRKTDQATLRLQHRETTAAAQEAGARSQNSVKNPQETDQATLLVENKLRHKAGSGVAAR